MSELYLYNVFDLDLIFNILYTIITFGHEESRDKEEE